MSIELIHGHASAWEGAADLVLTHPYARLPKQLVGVPAIINLFLPPGMERSRRRQGEAYVGAALDEIGRWANGSNAVYVANLPPRAIDLSDLVTEQVYPGGGCFPEALPRRLLELYQDRIPEGGTVWDGFMGRGTVGKVAREVGYRYVGIDRDPERVRIAREYLGA